MPGAAPLDPWSAGFNALGSAANGIGQALGGPNVSGNTARDQAWAMDSSGWSVSVPVALGPGASAVPSAASLSPTMLLTFGALALGALWIFKSR